MTCSPFETALSKTISPHRSAPERAPQRRPRPRVMFGVLWIVSTSNGRASRRSTIYSGSRTAKSSRPSNLVFITTDSSRHCGSPIAAIMPAPPVTQETGNRIWKLCNTLWEFENTTLLLHYGTCVTHFGILESLHAIWHYASEFLSKTLLDSFCHLAQIRNLRCCIG